MTTDEDNGEAWIDPVQRAARCVELHIAPQHHFSPLSTRFVWRSYQLSLTVRLGREKWQRAAESSLVSGVLQALKICRLQPPPGRDRHAARTILPISPFLPVSQERAAARIGVLHLLDCRTAS